MTWTAGDFPVSYWRGLLDSRWQAEVRRVIELSIAYCDAENGQAAGRLRRAQSRAAAARRSLADIEEAMERLTAGRFGRCEQCGTDMPARWLARTPEARYCPSCSPGAATAAWLARSPATRPVLTRVLAPLAALPGHLRHAARPGVI